MPKRKFIGLLGALGLAAQFVSGQLEPDCNPLHTDCPAKKAWPEKNYYIDFTKQKGPPANWIIANYEVVNFTPQGAKFTYAKRGDAPNMWTDFYILGGRYDVEMQIAPGQGVISSAVLWSDIQDEIDWEFSGNQHGEKPFPPPDGKWMVETNIFAQGKMWDGAAAYQRDALNPTKRFHTYSVEWDENHINWYVDNKVVRTVRASKVPSGFILPQSPMKLQLGVWGGGDPGNNYWTIQWAGGEIDMKHVPYTMYVRSVNITNKYPACQYKYKDRTGKITGIDNIHEGCGSSAGAASTSTSTTQSKIINNPETETSRPISDMNIDPSSMTSEPVSTSGAASPSSSSSSLVYPTSDTVTDQPSSASSAPSSELTPSTVTGGYPVISPSSTGGFLSSLSSLFLGTSSGVSSISVSSMLMPSGNGTYPATPITTSGSTLTNSLDPTPETPGSSLTTPATTSIFQSLTVGNNDSSIGGIVGSTISTIYSTNIYTITSCAPTVENCPVGEVSTELISLTTTLCPVTEATGSGTVTTSNFDSESGMSSTPTSSPETGSPPPSSFASSLSSSSVPFVFSNTSSETMPTTYSFSSEIITSVLSTVYSTNIITITSCPPTVKDCPVGQVTTEIVSLYTTVCPVTNTVIDGKTFSGQPSQAGSTTAVISSTLTPTLQPLIPSQSSASIGSSSSSSTSLVPSVGTSSLAYISSGIYQNTTVPVNGSILGPSTQPTGAPVQLTTSTVYSTNIYTITSCAPTVSNCPAQLGQVTTELVSLYTTICPVEQEGVTTSLQGTSNLPVPTSTSSIPSPSSTTPLNSLTPSAPVLTTSTVYTSSVYTVSSCEPGATQCSSNIGSVTTELVALYTTVCPVEDTPSSPLATPGVDSTAPAYTTSTVYSTNVYTVTSCASDVTDCPGKLGAVTTEIVAVSTTICPVTDKTVPTSVPQVTQSGYTTTDITISNTFNNSVIVITSIITFIDTPIPYSSTADISTDSTTATEPCTTITLGSYFTTVITYASLTQQPPASVSSDSVLTSYYTLTSTPEVDVPSYTMTEVESTVGLGSSGTIVVTTSVAATQTLPSVPQGEPGQCVCEPTISTVYATVTVAETTITHTETVEPPFPSTYGTGTGTGVTPLGTGASSQPTVKRRWFRRAQGHGHEQGHYW